MGDFKWDIWFTKLCKGLGAVLLSTGLIYTADYMQTTDFPPEYAFWAGMIILIMTQVGNYIKHTYMVKT